MHSILYKCKQLQVGLECLLIEGATGDKEYECSYSAAYNEQGACLDSAEPSAHAGYVGEEDADIQCLQRETQSKFITGKFFLHSAVIYLNLSSVENFDCCFNYPSVKLHLYERRFSPS